MVQAMVRGAAGAPAGRGCGPATLGERRSAQPASHLGPVALGTVLISGRGGPRAGEWTVGRPSSKDLLGTFKMML